MGNSTVSFEKAVVNVIEVTSRTVKNIKSAYIKEMHFSVKQQDMEYQVTT
jgi:hypothetical protein